MMAVERKMLHYEIIWYLISQRGNKQLLAVCASSAPERINTKQNTSHVWQTRMRIFFNINDSEQHENRLRCQKSLKFMALNVLSFMH